MAGHRWSSVGDEFLKYLVAAYQTNGTLHAPTLISASASLAGEFALMSHETNLPEFGIVQSPKVTHFIHGDEEKHRTLWGYTTTIAREAFQVQDNDLPSYKDVIDQLGVQLLPGSFPQLSAPHHLSPHDAPMNAGPKHRKAIYQLSADAGVDHKDAAFALMTAAMKTVGEIQQVNTRDVIVLALESMVAGSRFVPLLDVAFDPCINRVTETMMPKMQVDPAIVPVHQMDAKAAVAAALS